MRHDEFDAAATLAGRATWFGAGTAGIFGGLSISEAMAIGGFVIALIGALTNWWYRHRADQRSQRLYEHRIERMDAGKSDHGPVDETDQ
jgi:hypothetical protein